ncbi:MAG: O-antigen ligase family protein [Prosthecobacter sp.]|nr:O-antigen ligase family protein [Prosthecobacter sp.]
MNVSATTISPAWSDTFAGTLRPMAAQIAVTGYLAGFSVLPNEWFHLGWLLLVGGLAFVWKENLAQGLRQPVHLGACLIAAFLLWMTLRSCGSEAFLQGHASGEVMRGGLGSLLLALFCALTWQMARDHETLRTTGWITGILAGCAALISLMLTYFVLPGHVAGERLVNVLVHGGLNPICTGLIFGFSAVWLAALVEGKALPLSRRLAWALIALLHLVAFFSGSRGVMLALACGHAALLLARGWRRGAAALGVFVITGMLYFTSAPLLARITTWRAESAVEIETPALTHHLQKAVERGDNGRFDIYRAGWNAIDNPWLGTGQWGVRDVWQCELQPDSCSMMTHLHSAFFATFVHGGIIGTVLLFALLLQALRCARNIAQKGDVTWLALLAFGCGGLLFDGESLTAPRFEGLLFWLPVVVVLRRDALSASN